MSRVSSVEEEVTRLRSRRSFFIISLNGALLVLFRNGAAAVPRAVGLGRVRSGRVPSSSTTGDTTIGSHDPLMKHVLFDLSVRKFLVTQVFVPDESDGST